MEFIPVQSFSNYVEAHIAMGSLQHEHINCWLKDEYTVTIDPLLTNAIGGIKLMVAKVQVPRAVEILKKAAGNLPKQYACPHCGSREIQWVEKPAKKISLFAALFNRLRGRDDAWMHGSWHCAACHKSCMMPDVLPAGTMQDAT